MTRAKQLARGEPRMVFHDRREADRVLASLLSADAVIHIDKTRALEPLGVTSLWVAGETPETYPTGLVMRQNASRERKRI